MSLELPTRKVEYTTNWSSWTDISDDTIEFHIKRQDLSMGLWEFKLILDDTDGAYSLTAFPAINTEQGLHDGFRFYVNDDIRMIGRAIGVESESGYGEGEVFKVYGVGLGQEAMNLEASSASYLARQGDDIIAAQFTALSPSDISYSGGVTSTYTYLIVPDTGIPKLYDVIVEVADLINYASSFDSTQKAAPLEFWAKNDSSKQLNTVLKSVLNSQDNNIISFRQARSVIGLYNYIRLEQYEGHDINFSTEVPNLTDKTDNFSIGAAHWTETMYGPYAAMWVKTAGNDLDVDDTAANVYEGEYSIWCDGLYTAAPDFYLDLNISPLLTDLDITNESIDYLSFWHKETTCAGAAMTPRITLDDNDSHSVYVAFPINTSGIILNQPIGGAWAGWSGDTGTFTNVITNIHFSDETDHSAHSGDNPDMWIDRLFFYENGGNDTAFLSDATSIAAYGQREIRLPLPPSFPYINTYRWGLQALDSMEQPMRIVTVTTAIDPALVKEDDDSTPADFRPGWSLQLDIPRQKLNTVANGGKYWRILSSHEHWTPRGYTVDFELTPTTSESPDDYSQTSSLKLLGYTNPQAGIDRAIARKQKFLTHKSYERYG